jgi:alkaline phosphatase D
MTSIDRRTLLRAGLAGGAASTFLGSPAMAFKASGRPVLTHGVQTGDATADSAVVWTRADRPGRLSGCRPVAGPTSGAPGTFRTATTRRRDIRFVWTGDVVGQGWGIDPAYGGLKIFESMRHRRPDFLLHSGDTVYSDGPLAASVTLPDGRVYRNLVTEAKSKVAETLTDYRGQYAYNLLDDHDKAFTAEVAQVNQWDDHEVLNNWYPGEILTDARYTEKRVDVLAQRAHQAFHDWVPVPGSTGTVYRKLSYGPLLDVFVLDMRTFKDPNDGDVYADPNRGMLGHEQRQWLINGLRHSRATWKIIANDLPLGLVVPDEPGHVRGRGPG